MIWASIRGFEETARSFCNATSGPPDDIWSESISPTWFGQAGGGIPTEPHGYLAFAGAAV